MHAYYFNHFNTGFLAYFPLHYFTEQQKIPNLSFPSPFTQWHLVLFSIMATDKRKKKAQHLNRQVFVFYLSCSWDSVEVVRVAGRGGWGVLPWLFLSLHCTGCESRGSHLTSHKNSGQMTCWLRDRERQIEAFEGWRSSQAWRTRPPRCPATTSDPNWTNNCPTKIERDCLNLNHGA